MNKIFYWLFLGMGGGLLFSCNQKTINNEGSLFKMKGEKIIYLDQNTPPSCFPVSSFSSCDSDFVAIYNRYEKKIKIHEYTSGKLVCNIDLNKFNYVSGIFVLNKDSIFVFTMPDKNLYLFSSDNQIKNKIYISGENGSIKVPGMPDINFGRPVIVTKDFWYLCCWKIGQYDDVVKGRRDRPVALRINIKTGEGTYFSGYPEDYLQQNLGRLNYYEISQAFDPVSQNIVYNFQASSVLSVYNTLTGKESFHSVRSCYFDTVPPPFKNFTKDVGDSNFYEKYYSNPIYMDIYFDQWRKLFYRIVLHRLKKPDIRKGAGVIFEKPVSVIIMDENLKILGEHYLGTDYIYTNLFINRYGLHILRKAKGEDFAVYDVFEYSPKIK